MLNNVLFIIHAPQNIKLFFLIIQAINLKNRCFVLYINNTFKINEKFSENDINNVHLLYVSVLTSRL